MGAGRIESLTFTSTLQGVSFRKEDFLFHLDFTTKKTRAIAYRLNEWSEFLPVYDRCKSG
jgi:hypothetical protein